MNKLSFHKMHGLGNDFIVIDLFDQAFTVDRERIQWLADRYRGVGCDQLLVVGPSPLADVACQIFNADGSEAEQCGNGMRCVARYVHEEKRVPKLQMTIATKAGIIPVEIQDYNKIRVNMGKPEYQMTPLRLSLDTIPIELTTLSLGNPHAIYRVETLMNVPLDSWGKTIASNAAFPQGVNVGFMEIVNRQHIRLRTHERGVGETRACGSNACAAAVAGILNHWLDPAVEVEVAYGKLLVEWSGSHHPVFLTGPASRVFSGVLAF